jgi:hypothetical protein
MLMMMTVVNGMYRRKFDDDDARMIPEMDIDANQQPSIEFEERYGFG